MIVFYPRFSFREYLPPEIRRSYDWLELAQVEPSASDPAGTCRLILSCETCRRSGYWVLSSLLPPQSMIQEIVDEIRRHAGCRPCETSAPVAG